ncbi:MurR/RpiR family transcriptional regulator [Rhodococcus olei]|uniref:MurR/RpiR family transcriptional regulator n=1 Tax=Rhodococcus olei TaxID=2161675 RepID=A0ABP8P9A2_9NOCA
MQSKPADPPPGTTLATIRSLAPTLPPGERRVAQVCLDRPADVAWWSAADLAEQAATSTATVVRACQKLGFSGFQHLRMLLLRDVGAERAVTPGEGAVPGESGPGLLPTIFAEVAHDLSAALAPLDVDAMRAAVRALADARRVLVVGNGGSAPAAAAAAFRFTSKGRPVEAPADAIIQQLTARQLGPGDVCLVISDTGLNSLSLDSAAAARAGGATVVGVTGHPRSPLVDGSDIALVVGAGAGPWSAHGAGSSVIQLTFLIALQIEVSAARGDLEAVTEAGLQQVIALMEPPGPERGAGGPRRRRNRPATSG